MSKQIKSWQECVTDTTLLTDYPDLMQAEIKELRAALATPPVASGALTEDQLTDTVRSLGYTTWAQSQEVARAVLAAVPAAAAPNAALVDGYVMVPVKPSHAMLKAMAESRAFDDEGEFPTMTDLLDFSGENKTRTVLEAAYVAALAQAGAA